MQRVSFFFLTLFTLLSSGYASPSVIIRNVLRIYPLDSNGEWLIDSSASMQLDDVRAKTFNSEINSINRVPPQGALWLKTNLIAEDQITDWLLLLKNPSLESLSNRSVYAAEFCYMDAFFIHQDGKIESKKDGYFVPRRERAYYDQPLANAVPFSVEKEDTLTIYVRVFNPLDGIKTISWELRPQTLGIPKDKTGLANLMTFCMGVTSILGLLCFFFFLADKDYANLYFSIFCYLLMFHYSIIHTELPFVKWFVPERPWLAEYAWYLMTNLLSVFFVLFVRSFVNLREHSKRWDQIAIFVLASSLFCLTLSLLNHDLSWQLSLEWLNGLVFACTLILVIRIAFLPGYLSKIVAFGSIWMLVFGILGILSNMGYFGKFLPWPIGQLGMMVIYTFGLAYKLQLNERSKAEAHKVLELDAIKSRFFANISHEFRTPLTLILGPLKKAQEQVPASELAEIEESSKVDIKVPAKHIGFMRRNAERLQQLIDQLLDLAKLENGSMSLQLSKGDVVPFLRALVYSFESLAEMRQIHFQTEFPAGGALQYFDRDKLEKIVTNLLSNAFKFTPTLGKVFVRAQLEKGRLKVTIEDSGNGIPPEELEKIFERFYQVEGTEDQGTGIGLALVKELVQIHHGQISVESAQGKGTIFKISIPVDQNFYRKEEIDQAQPFSSAIIRDANPNTQTETDSTLSASPKNQGLPLLLIVEDNPDLRRFIAETLQNDFSIATAENGRSGLNMALELTPDIVLSDVMMPEMDGFIFCETLKKNERTSHIPVILLTAKAGQEHKMAGLETGADVYMTKPFDEAELRIQARNLVDQRQRLRKRYEALGEFQRMIHMGPASVAVTSADQRFLEKVSKAIENNIDNEFFSVEDLAGIVFFSRSQLHRKLKSITGKSPNELIREYRLTRAKDLLEQGHGNVTEVAMSVGYSSLSYFSRSFKDAFGVMPSEL